MIHRTRTPRAARNSSRVRGVEQAPAAAREHEHSDVGIEREQFASSLEVEGFFIDPGKALRSRCHGAHRPEAQQQDRCQQRSEEKEDVAGVHFRWAHVTPGHQFDRRFMLLWW